MRSRFDVLNTPGKNLRAVREGLGLKYRDVEEASLVISTRNKNPEFLIGLSRLADIENKGTVPSIFRMYTLAAVYGLDFGAVLALYGVDLSKMASDIAELQLDVTKPLSLYTPKHGFVEVPLQFLGPMDLRKSTFFSRQIQTWGRLPLQFLEAADRPHHRYARVGDDDWSMFPIIPPGSFVQIDETKHKIVNGGWDNDFSRPIYFLELREGYRFGWCTERSGNIIVQPHSSASLPAEVFKHPGEIEVLGQVVGVAMRLNLVKRRRKRSA